MMLKKSFYCLLFFVLLLNLAKAQTANPNLQRVEPAFWWVGMKNPEVQVLFYGKDIARSSVSVNYPGVDVREVVLLDNPNYLLLTLHIGPKAQAGKVPVVFKAANNKQFTHQYELKNRVNDPTRFQGFSSADLIYLIMPDRFSNGDPSNDRIPGMSDLVQRDSGLARHGGDLRGITNHLGYIKELGATAIWLNPVLENNMPAASYHGYAITDLYNVDKRFGGNEAYLEFVGKSHSMGLKVIKDMVFNHLGLEHWMVKDPPGKDWYHVFENYTSSNFRLSTISDPYASKKDLELMSDGWFDKGMPDMNQKNKYLARYFIQNSIWWIEYAGLDGIRVDTYPYPDKDFMADWTKAVLDEYPKFNVVGEVWIHNSSAISAYWQKGTANKDGYQSTLPAITDFPVYNAILRGLNEKMDWDTGLSRLYYVLAEDFVYNNPSANVIFLDNHDLSRFFSDMGRDVNKLKMGLAILMTMRGTPQLYYGTEIAMDGYAWTSHGNIRKDFPGGWPGDTQNAFTREGRTALQNEVFDYVKTLANWRKNNPVIHSGKLTHFVPGDEIYVYFRHNEQKTVMVVLNSSDKEKTVSTKRFAELTGKYSKARNVVSQEVIQDLQTLTVPAKTALVLELE